MLFLDIYLRSIKKIVKILKKYQKRILTINDEVCPDYVPEYILLVLPKYKVISNNMYTVISNLENFARHAKINPGHASDQDIILSHPSTHFVYDVV